MKAEELDYQIELLKSYNYQINVYYYIAHVVVFVVYRQIDSTWSKQYKYRYHIRKELGFETILSVKEKRALDRMKGQAVARCLKHMKDRHYAETRRNES